MNPRIRPGTLSALKEAELTMAASARTCPASFLLSEILDREYHIVV